MTTTTKNKISNDLQLYSDNNFEEFYNFCPDQEYSVITTNGKIHTTARRHKSYGNTPVYDEEYFKNRNYMFSSRYNLDVNSELPELFKPFLDFVQINYNQNYNQVTINWFDSHQDYIPLHIDCDYQLDKTLPIIVISLGSTRTFTVRDTTTGIKTETICENGTILSFPCNIQHGILKQKTESSKRISLSFRAYNRAYNVNKK